jgi:hypothetical protein
MIHSIIASSFLREKPLVPDDLTLIPFSDFTWFRNSIATYIDDRNVRQTVPINQPTFDYNDGYERLIADSATTNLFLNSETLSTQTIVITRSNVIVSFEGTGSITFSGIATSTLTGTGVNDRVSISIETGSGGDLISAVSGSVKFAQAEEANSQGSTPKVFNYESTYIPSLSTKAKREEDRATATISISNSFTFYTDFRRTGQFNNTNVFLLKIGSSDDNDFIMFHSAVGVGRVIYRINGGSTQSIQFSQGQYPNIYDKDFLMKFSISSNGTNTKVFVNGLHARSGTGVISPINITGLRTNLFTQINIKLGDLSFFKTRAKFKEFRLENQAYTDRQNKQLTSL